MDLPTRLVGLQQVMSGIAHMCPKGSVITLRSAEHYHIWVRAVQSLLVPLGLGLYEFFEEGDLLIPLDGSLDEATVTLLRGYLNRVLHIVLLNTVDQEIIDILQCEGLFGYDLLLAVKRDYSTLTARQLSQMVDTFLQVPSMQPSQALKVLRTFRAQFANGISIDQLFGLVYLKSFSDPSAASRILDVSSPQLTLRTIELSLRDLATPANDDHTAVFATSSTRRHASNEVGRKQCSQDEYNPSSSAATLKQSTRHHELKFFEDKQRFSKAFSDVSSLKHPAPFSASTKGTCKRCWTRGHNSITCPAPSPVSRISATSVPDYFQPSTISRSSPHVAVEVWLF
jgi:hypothetical protein